MKIANVPNQKGSVQTLHIATDIDKEQKKNQIHIFHNTFLTKKKENS